jgi:hypothetical protein
MEGVRHQPVRSRRAGRRRYDPAGLGFGDEADPGAVDLHGQRVDGFGDGGEAVVLGAPELGRELGQHAGHRGEDPGGALIRDDFEHMSILAEVADNDNA